MQPRLGSLNGVRALCAAWVVLHHAWCFWEALVPHEVLRRLSNPAWLPWWVQM